MKNINNDEAQLAAGMNFDIDEIQPFLNRLSSSVLDSGFTYDEINSIQSEIEKMKENNEVKEISIFNVNFNEHPKEFPFLKRVKGVGPTVGRG